VEKEPQTRPRISAKLVDKFLPWSGMSVSGHAVCRALLSENSPKEPEVDFGRKRKMCLPASARFFPSCRQHWLLDPDWLVGNSRYHGTRIYRPIAGIARG